VVICLERDADLHMAQLMPLPLTVSCFSKIQTGFTFLVCVCVCVCVRACVRVRVVLHIMSSLPAPAVAYVLGCVYTSRSQSGISLTACCEILTLT